jgi:hypothetical protein
MVDRTVIIAGTNSTIVKKVVVGPPVRSIIQASGRLAVLSDVNIGGVSDGNLLAYDSATSKWIASNALPPVNVVAGTYGSATEIPVFTILSDGRIDSASTVTVAGVTDFNYDSASGKLTISTADGSNFETVISLDPFTTGVTPGTYGSASEIPVLTIDAQGRIDSAGLISVATNLSISGDSGTDTVSLLSDTLSFAGGSNITTGISDNTVTIGLNNSISLSGITTSGDITVGGNLTVNGATITINSETLNIADNMIYLNSEDSAGSPVVSVDLGWAGNRNEGSGYAHTGFFRDATDGIFKVYDGYIPEPDDSIEINTSHASFALAPFQAHTLTGKYLGFDSDLSNKLIGEDSAISFYTDVNTDRILRINDATYTQRGLAFFDNTQFSVVSAGVSIIDIDGGEY